MHRSLLRQCLIFCIAAMASASCAAAVGTNFGDHWADIAEPGWGAAIQQQADVLFVQLLVYASDGSPAWYAASAMPQQAPVPGHSVFSGDLYRTRGPVGAGPFDPSAVSARKVGTLGFDADTSDTATLSYTIDGVAMAKPVTRLTWKLEDLTGHYYGGLVWDFSPTHGPCITGHFEDLGPLAVSQSGPATLVITAEGSTRTCTFTGDYAQRGHIGTSRGTFLCTGGGLSGTYTGFELERSAQGLTGRITGETVSCEFDGRLGGVRR